MSRIMTVGIAISGIGALIAVGAIIIALASVPFWDGRMASPSGPVGKAAVIGLLIAFSGLPLFIVGVIINLRRR